MHPLARLYVITLVETKVWIVTNDACLLCRDNGVGLHCLIVRALAIWSSLQAAFGLADDVTMVLSCKYDGVGEQ